MTTRHGGRDHWLAERLAGLAAACPPTALSSGMLLADFRASSSFLLTLGGLPPPQFPPAFGVTAITVVPAPRLKDLTAALAQAHSLAQR